MSARPYFLILRGGGFVVELYETSPAGAGLPLEIGTVSVREVQTPLHLLAPYRGQAVQAAAAFNTQMGLEWPGPNELKRKGGVYELWFDHAHIAVMGTTPSTRLARHAAVTDVGDGWTVLELNGAEVRDVLARLTPLDLRVKQFKTGMSQRSSLMHMQAVISCHGKSRFRVMVFRSMTQTLLHDLTTAMESVAARAHLV